MSLTAEDQSDFVTFALSGETMAIPASLVREILEPVDVTRVPQASASVAGLINVRGAVVPLADLRVGFGMVPNPATEDTRMLVLELTLRGRPLTVAIYADRVNDVTRIGASQIDDIPPVGTSWPPGFVKGITNWQGDFVLLPDLERVFSHSIAGTAAAGTMDEGV